MKRLTIILAVLASTSAAVAQLPERELGNVTVTARRPMKEIGVTKTTLDSAALKENVAQSMADVLTYNSSVFVKSYGRATLSTVAFRGTSPSHTQVTWNGMRINSPMLGMTDFSTIPAYFIDRASLLHGSSSVNEAGGGLGGAVKLGTAPDMPEGWGLRYVQGVGSFKTFDEFLRLTYADSHWAISTRAVYSSSPNDFKYVNRDKMLNIYDDEHNIIGKYHPVERNRSGAFKDLHLLQEVYYNTLRGDRLGMNVWYVNSNRELPMLTTDYAEDTDFNNRQREHTLRALVTWDHSRSSWKTALRGGYINTWMAYDYERSIAPGTPPISMTRSRSQLHTAYAQAEGEYSPARQWYVTGSATLYQHFARSADRSVAAGGAGGAGSDYSQSGYDKARVEFSAAASVRWQPKDGYGLSAVGRQELFGRARAPFIPALFADALISRAGNVTARASVTRNHRFPSLNDLYFMPGGNPDLKPEKGMSYDAGVTFLIGRPERYSLGGGVTWFDSTIDNWIIWLPTTKGFFSPRNVKKVHAYGVESNINLTWRPTGAVTIDFNGSYSWTPSINVGEPMSAADRSPGRQLPYVPRHSASWTARLQWGRWAVSYKWCFYSRRYTMSSNDNTLTGQLPTYFMNNASIERMFAWCPLDLSVKLALNNLLNEEYLSVLGRPMPRMNFELFFSVTPRF